MLMVSRHYAEYKHYSLNLPITSQGSFVFCFVLFFTIPKYFMGNEHLAAMPSARAPQQRGAVGPWTRVPVGDLAWVGPWGAGTSCSDPADTSPGTPVHTACPTLAAGNGKSEWRFELTLNCLKKISI